MTQFIDRKQFDECIRNSKKRQSELDTANETILNLETELAALGKTGKVSSTIEELIENQEKILPGVPAYFELKQKYDKAVETNRLLYADIETLKNEKVVESPRNIQRIKELIEKNRLCDETVVNLTKELFDLHMKDYVVLEKELVEENKQLKKELSEMRIKEAYPLDGDEKLTNLKEDNKLLDEMLTRCNKETESQAECIRNMEKESVELGREIIALQNHILKQESGEKELTKDLFRLNDENKDYIETIRKLQVEIKVFEESYNHIHNQLKQLVIEVEELSK